MGRGTINGLAALAAVLWAAFVIYDASAAWPRLPLDLPAKDPSVRAAYDEAVARHVRRTALTAGTPLLLAGLLIALNRGRRRKP